MKRLESLSAFADKKLNKVEMSKIKGGVEQVTETAGGVKAVHEARSSSGCMVYSKDTTGGPMGDTYTPEVGGDPGASDVPTEVCGLY